MTFHLEENRAAWEDNAFLGGWDLLWNKVSLRDPGWPRNCGPPSSASGVLRWQGWCGHTLPGFEEACFPRAGWKLRWATGLSVEENLGHTQRWARNRIKIQPADRCSAPEGRPKLWAHYRIPTSVFCRLRRAAWVQLDGAHSQGHIQVEKRDWPLLQVGTPPSLPSEPSLAFISGALW